MSPEMLPLLLKSFWETCYMVLASTILATVIGIPLGVILTVTRRDHILPNTAVNGILGAIVNATRSTPFIILMVAIIPLTRIIVGSSIGTTAAIVPLTISAAPFIARIIERGLVQAGRRVTLTTCVVDRPGALQKLLASIAASRGNVLYVHHDRIQNDVPLGQAKVQVSLETRDTAHTEEILDALQKEGYQVTQN